MPISESVARPLPAPGEPLPPPEPPGGGFRPTGLPQVRAARISRLLALVLAALTVTGATFVLYVTLFYPVDEAQRRDILSKVSLLLTFGGGLDVFLMWLALSPVRQALSERDRGRESTPAQLESLNRRAAAFPYLGSTLTMGLWVLGSLTLALNLSAEGYAVDALVAGALTGLCTGLVSAMLVFYISVAELFPVRALHAQEKSIPTHVRGAPIGGRVLLIAIAVLLVGVAMVGATAYINHRHELESSATASCDRALKAISAFDAGSQALADAAAAACGGPVTVAMADQVVAGVGARALHRMKVGRGPDGVVLTTELRSGATLYALVSDRSQHDQRKSFALDMLSFTFLAVLLAVGVALAGARAITMPIRGLADGAEAVAEGDLTRSVPVLTSDEIGSLASSFSAMSGRLRYLVTNISDAAGGLSEEVSTVNTAGQRVLHGLEARRDGVAGATREMTDMDHSVASVGRDVLGLSEYVSTASSSLAELAQTLDGVRRQGAELDRAVESAREEVAALVKAAESVRREIAAMSAAANATRATVAESSGTLRGLSLAAAESDAAASRVVADTDAGRQVVEETLRGVEAIRGVVGEAKSRVQALGARGEDITAIVDFIAEVAGRTNLLSLNAAIIAAQAGEQGKPFGVVAEHIRELAVQIGNSTKRIGDIIAGVRVEVDATSALIQQSDELAAVGVERAREGGKALSRIAEGTRRAREISASILPAVTSHVESTRQIEELAAGVVEMADRFQGVELLVRGGKSIEALAQSLAPLTSRVGRALDEQAEVSRRQLESLEEINQMITRLNLTVARHGEGTARVLKNLNELVAMADEDRTVVNELASAAETLQRHAVALREGLGRFRI